MKQIWPESGSDDMRIARVSDETWETVSKLAQRSVNPDYSFEIARRAILADRDSRNSRGRVTDG